MVRVGSTCNCVCGSAGMADGSRPMRRKVLPSIRTRPVRRWDFPVQCVVSAPVRLSAGDQMLKYGLHVTRGTDGGRNDSAAKVEKPSAREVHSAPRRQTKFLFIDTKI